MKKTIRILAIVAAVQLVLIGVSYVGGDDSAIQKGSTRLLTFNTADVDTIVMTDQHQKGVTLKKAKEWQTASGFPADSQRITSLLQRLHDLKHGLAIATSESARTRFKVDEKSFERHLLLRKGDTVLAELYLGNGAGARHSYARSAREHAVYSVALGSYDLPLEDADWQDKTILQIQSKDITSIGVGGITLTKQQSATQPSADGVAATAKKADVVWTTQQLPAGKQVNQKAVIDAVKLLQSLRFSKVIGKALPAGVDMAGAKLAIHASYSGKQRDYQFAKQDKGKDYILKVSDRPEYFLLNEYTARELVKQMNPDTWFVDQSVETSKHDAESVSKTSQSAEAAASTPEE